MYLLLLAGIAAVCSGTVEDVAIVEGKVVLPPGVSDIWLRTVRLVLDGGQYVTFPRADGSFSFLNVESGSYLLEVENPSQKFDSIRIDVNSRGKVRARQWNILKPAQVEAISHPLKLKSLGPAQYFIPREEMRIQDMLMNPMVLMMVLPLLLLTAMPKMNDDPEVKEMQAKLNGMMSPSQQMPDISEGLTRMLGGGPEAKTKQKKKKA